MGQVLHGSATTTEAIRRAIQHSEASLRELAKRYGINPKTVAKWKTPDSVADLRTGPKEARSTVLSIEDEAVVVAFRRHTLLPLDDCLYALQPTIPHLTRSSLHRCLQRHGICRLPETDGDKPAAQVQALPDRLLPYRHRRGADRSRASSTSSSPSTAPPSSPSPNCTRRPPARRRRLPPRLIAAVPYKIHTVLTDNGIQFTDAGAGGSADPEIQDVWRRVYSSVPLLRAGLRQPTSNIALTKPRHPMDQRSGRADEPHDQGRDRQALPLRDHDQLRRTSLTSSRPTTSPAA